MFTNHGDLLIDIEQSIYSLLMSRPESDEQNAWDTIVSQKRIKGENERSTNICRVVTQVDGKHHHDIH